MADNNTSSFNDRLVAGSKSLSMHAYGLAIDLNPEQDPFIQRAGTASRLIRAMKQKGLVSRKRLEDNARTVAINLTAKSNAAVEELMPIAIHFEEVAIRSLPEDGFVILRGVLTQSIVILDRSSPRSLLPKS